MTSVGWVVKLTDSSIGLSKEVVKKGCQEKNKYGGGVSGKKWFYNLFGIF